MWQTLKAFFFTIIVIGSVALVIALVYFLTIFGGVAIIVTVVFLVIREYNREVAEIEKANKNKEDP